MSQRPVGFGRLDIARAVAVMLAFVLLVGAMIDRDEPPGFPAPVPDGSAIAPIASEAGVFRLRPEELAVATSFVGDRQGHRRSLEIYRRLRAYPGAPPRIPHGLTDEEYRTGRCNVCHEKGGWVARFGTYAPVTPHPEYGSCLQCHAPSDELVGVPLPESERTLVCVQCHVDPDRAPATFVPTDWRAAAWPDTDVQAMDGSPHVVPHDVAGRSNCLACHAGPSAIAELRTDHPERVSCRQCHVPAGGAEVEPEPGGRP